MTQSARLEIHVMNVGQGDSVLVINRALDELARVIAREADPASIPVDPIDYVPYALKNDISLADTVSNAMLVDGGDDEYGGDVVSYLIAQGVVNRDSVYQPNLSLVVSHYHDDHTAGLRSVFKQRNDQRRPGGPELVEGTGRAPFTRRFPTPISTRPRSGTRASPPTWRAPRWRMISRRSASTSALAVGTPEPGSG